METDRYKIFPSDNDATEILIIISAPEFEYKKTMRVALKETFGNVLNQFIKKGKIDALPYFYNLYLEIPGVCSEIMDEDARLDSIPLPTPVCIFLQQVIKYINSNSYF